MAIANVNGVEIYYETQGSGEPVLLVPQSWWPCATWNVVVVPTLARRYRTIIYDERWTGRGEKPKDEYTVRQIADAGSLRRGGWRRTARQHAGGDREDAGAVDSGSGVSVDSKDQTYDVLGWRRRADRVTRFLGPSSDRRRLNPRRDSCYRHTP